MEQLRTVTREFQTGDKAVLHLESRSGSVLVESRDADRIVVEATVKIWSDIAAEADDAAELVLRHMEQDGHRVIVRAPPINSSEKGILAHLDITVVSEAPKIGPHRDAIRARLQAWLATLPEELAP